ncbi:MAG: PQQ-binding-like beta-propeller repeat protein, partial [Myxococcota bacterium]
MKSQRFLRLAALPSLLLVFAALACDEGAEGRPEPDPTPGPAGPPTWDSAEVRRQWTHSGFGEPFALLPVEGGKALIVAGRRLARLETDRLREQDPTWQLIWPEDTSTMLGLENRAPWGGHVLDLGDDGREEVLILDNRNVYLVSASTGEILRMDRLEVEGFVPFSIELFGEESSPGYAVASGNLEARSAESGEKLWTADFQDWAFTSKGARLAEDESGLVVALEVTEVNMDGQVTVPNRPAVYGFSGDGRELFDFTPEGLVWSLAVGDLVGDGLDEVLVGTDASKLHALTPGGLPLWTADMGGGIVRDVVTADLTGDGRHEILATLSQSSSRGGQTIAVALDPNGNEIWRTVAGQEYARLRLHQLGGGQAILACHQRDYWGRDPGSIVILDPLDGDILWQKPSGALSTAIVRVHGEELLAFGGSDTRVRLVDPLTGRQKYEHAGGSFLTSVATADLTDDGVDEMVVGDDKGRLAAFDVSRNRLWQVHLPQTTINDVAAAELRPGEGVRAVAVGMGSAQGSAGWAQIHSAGGEHVAHSGNDSFYYWEAELADLNEDGELEILAAASSGLDSPGAVVQMNADAGIDNQVTLPACFATSIAVAQAQEGQPPQIAVLGMRALGPSWVALLESDLSVRWIRHLSHEASWIELFDGDVLVAGRTGNPTVADRDILVRMAGEDGLVVWRYESDPPAERLSGFSSGTLIPGAGSDGGTAIAAGSEGSEVHLVDADSGQRLWVVGLQEEGIVER